MIIDISNNRKKKRRFEIRTSVILVVFSSILDIMDSKFIKKSF